MAEKFHKLSNELLGALGVTLDMSQGCDQEELTRQRSVFVKRVIESIPGVKLEDTAGIIINGKFYTIDGHVRSIN